MTVYAAAFYLIAALMAASTVMAVTRQNMVHAVLYLVVSFLGTALMFYLLGAPMLSILQVIIYAGAIMVLFLFIVMMIRVSEPAANAPAWPYAVAAGGLCAAYFIGCILLLVLSPGSDPAPMKAAAAIPAKFGYYLFARHWLAIEMISALLLIALVGTLLLGRGKQKKEAP